MAKLRGQGAFEYLLIIGGCVLIATLVIMIVQGSANQTNGVISGGTNSYLNFIQNMSNVSR